MVVMLRIAHCLSVDGNSARKRVFHPEKQLGGGTFIGGDFYRLAGLSHYASRAVTLPQ